MSFVILGSAPAVQAPELPNFISLLNETFPNHPVLNFLYEFENVIFSAIIALIISVIFIYGSRSKSLIPNGLQNLLEAFVSIIHRLATEILGPSAEKYVPFLGTLFIFLLSMNLFGIVPLMKSPTSSLSVTVAQAVCVFVLVQYLNIREMGVFGFLYHMAGSPKTFINWLVVPLILPIEILTQLSRPVTLALRLFGNVLGEDILIGFFALLGASFLPFFIPLQTPFVFLALFFSFIQALVFTLLTTIYILLAIPQPEESH